MKKLISLLLAVILILPACTTQKGGENMANMLYNGVELPDINTVWTDKETYPYAYIQKSDENDVANGAPPYGLFLSQYAIPSVSNEFTLYGNYSICGLVSDSWVLFSSGSADSFGINSNCPIVWCSVDIPDYLAASTPVPVGGSKLTISTGGSANGDGMALYNGVMLPKLPQYDESIDPYSDISVGTPSDLGLPYSGVIYLFNAYSKPGVRSSSDTLFIEASYHQLMYILTDSQEVSDFFTDAGIPVSVGEWSFFNDHIAQTDAAGVLPIWSSYDILNTDGTIYLATSDPIPLDGMNVITWDASDGLEQVTSIIDGTVFYKVFDASLSYDELLGGTLTLSDGTYSESIPLNSETVQDNGITVNIAGEILVSVPKGSAASEQILGGEFGVFSEMDLASVGLVSVILAYPASSGGEVTDTTATVNFSCKDLLYTDSVYRIKAWVYKVADGLDTTLPPTWTSELFAGTSHSESHTFTGLTPATDYAVYGVIWLENEGAASEHNATATFTTLEGEVGALDFSNTELSIFDPNVTANAADFAISWSGLPVTTDNHVQYFIFAELDDGTAATNSPFYMFSSDAAEDGEHEIVFSDLEPNTDYTVTAKLLYNTTGEFSGYTDSGVEVSYDFTTLADADPNSFPLGFASGLSGVPVTKANADHNRWMQGYIVGDAFRKML